MALSKPEVLNTAQHFLECSIEDCDGNCQFYCNQCHQPMCEPCRNEHLKSPKNRNHIVVPYRQREPKLPGEKCKIHPSKELDILCKECNAHLCSKCCTLQDHRGHTFIDLETLYADNYLTCHEKILQLRQYFLPTSQTLHQETKDDAITIRKIFDNIRLCMEKEATLLKGVVDTVTSENIDEVNKMEESIMECLKSQDKSYEEYTYYLNKLVKEFIGNLSNFKFQNNPLLFLISEALKIKPIPKTPKPIPPVFTAGQYSKDDVAKLLGRITVPDIVPENREIKPMETVIGQLKPTVKQKKQGGGKSDMKQTLSLSSSVTKVREYSLPGVKEAWHVSIDKSGGLWVSDLDGNLVHTDRKGNQLQQMLSSDGFGYHTVTDDDDLIFTETDTKVVNRITPSKSISEFINTGEWGPISIVSSQINGDILVGMFMDKMPSKITRYNKTGKEIQTIQTDNTGRALYEYPHYITENTNGDICTSDSDKQSVVVVTGSGQHRFSYTGQGSDFNPHGLCTDILGHILICDVQSKAVYLLDPDGQFLSLIVKELEAEHCPLSVCVDDDNNLCVGQNDKTVLVYKYLK